MPGITSACTCSVDGRSGNADTRYKDYSFTGCGAHVDYTYDTFSGAGYERTWCYVTSPPDCPGESPYIPEGFKTDNTLPEWEAQGAAWKECYDGYRCEAWWGGLEGSPEGEPVVLDAPLDWPDCCALCSDSNGGGGDADDAATTTTAACVAWSFDPSTGSCQRMSTVESMSYNDTWGVNSTVHGYPGYFEAPITDCWGRGQYDLCVNTNAALIIPGVIVAFFSLVCVYCTAFSSQTERTGVLTHILADPQSARLVKASCVSVRCERFVRKTGKGGATYFHSYEGTFITSDGALFVLPPTGGRSMAPATGRKIEKRMLSVLFANNVNPKANPAVARRCETPKGLRSEFLRMVKTVPARPVSETRSNPEQNAANRRFDCLLLMKVFSDRTVSTSKVVLVGILGEDRITCIDSKVLGLSSSGCIRSFCLLFASAATLIIMCVTLLTNEAAQNMAAWTFAGNHRVGAVIGLVLCVSIPLSCFAWHRHSNRKILALVEMCPPAAESDLSLTKT